MSEILFARLDEVITATNAPVIGSFLGSSDGITATYQSFLQVGTGAVARRWQYKVQEILSLTDYGAIGDGVSDAAVGLRKAVAAVPPGGKITVPYAAVTYLLKSVDGSGHVVQSSDKSFTIEGDGWSVNSTDYAAPRGAIFQMDASLPDTADIFSFVGTKLNFGLVLKNFAVVGSDGAFGSGNGRNIIHFDASASNTLLYQDVKIDHLWLANTKTGYSFKTTATGAATNGALANANIHDTTWMNSHFDYVGDNILLDSIKSGQNAIVDSRNVGVYMRQIDGGASFKIINGNYSNFNSAVVIDKAVGFFMSGVEMEQADGFTNANNAQVFLRGANGPILGATIVGSTFSQLNTTHNYANVIATNVFGLTMIGNRFDTPTNYGYWIFNSPSEGIHTDGNYFSNNGTIQLLPAYTNASIYSKINLPVSIGLPSIVDGSGQGRLSGAQSGSPNWSMPDSSGKVLVTNEANAITSFGLRSTGAAFDFKVASSEVLTANRTLLVVLGDTNRTLTLTANAAIGGSITGSNTGDQTITLSGDVSGSGTGPITALIGATKVTSAMLNADVFSTAHTWAGQQTFVAPILGTIVSGVATNLTGTAAGLTAGNVTTNANLTGEVTSVGNSATLNNASVIAKVLTGYTSGPGTVAATDTILQAIQKLNGNNATNANLTGVITSVGNATSIASQTGIGSKFVVDASPTITGLTVTGSFTATGLVGNAALANSTISGISLGSNLSTLTFGSHLTSGGSSYNGSAGITITSDATAANTASTIMLRDGSGQVAATTFTGALAGNATTASTASAVAVSNITGTASGVLTFLATSTSANFASVLTDETGSASGGVVVFNKAPNIIGSATNDAAAAGSIGEYLTNNAGGVSMAGGTAKTVTSVSLTAGDWDVEWFVNVQPAATTNVTQVTSSISTTDNTISFTIGDYSLLQYGAGGLVAGASNGIGMVGYKQRVSLSGTTTYYLVSSVNFSVSTLTASGIIGARRAR